MRISRIRRIERKRGVASGDDADGSRLSRGACRCTRCARFAGRYHGLPRGSPFGWFVHTNGALRGSPRVIRTYKRGTQKIILRVIRTYKRGTQKIILRMIRTYKRGTQRRCVTIQLLELWPPYGREIRERYSSWPCDGTTIYLTVLSHGKLKEN